MRLNNIYQTALLSGVLTCALTSTAQSPDFHVELSPGHRLESPGPMSHDAIVIVNDADRPISIEAYRLVQRCQYGGTWEITDASFLPRSTAALMRQAGSRYWFDAIEIDKKARFDTGLPNQTCENARGAVEKAQNQIDAVIFTDGTYEGKERAVRTLKAHRDGYSERLNYWARRLKSEDPDGSGLNAMLGEARCFVDADRAIMQDNSVDFFHFEFEPLLEKYSEGKLLVDKEVVEFLTHPENSPVRSYHQLFGQITWRKGIFDSHASTKKLDVEFPPIFEPIRTCGPGA